MVYSAGNLCTLAIVLMAETGWAKTHLSKLINGQPNTISRLLANPSTCYAETIEKLSDWFDENWPLHAAWPADVEQRRAARLGREERLDEALNERARKLRRFDERIRELVALREGLIGEDQSRFMEIANGHRAKVTRMSRVLEDLRNILVISNEGDEAPAERVSETPAETGVLRDRRSKEPAREMAE
jgi:hypothetical protein